MAIYDSCCWCLPLRTGCILIAVVDIIFQILANIAFVEMNVSLPVIISGNLIALTFTGLLIYGTIMQKRSWLWLWSTINVILMVLLGIFAVMAIIGYSSNPSEGPGAGVDKLFAVIVAVISTAVITAQIMFGLVVFSYLWKLREQTVEMDDRHSVESEN